MIYVPVTMILSVHNLSKSFAGVTVLQNVSFSLEKGEKLALVGNNGSGKSTLLKMIAGEERPDGGDIFLKEGTRIGHLPQEAVVDGESTIFEEVLKAKKPLLDMEKEMRELEMLMSGGGPGESDEALRKRYSYLSDRFEKEGGYAAETMAKGILKGLGFCEDEFQRKSKELSGGEKTRLALSRVLFEGADMIMLDEPTNHLDIDSLKWLEDFLAMSRKSLILVSHDRYFLDKITSKVLDIEGGRCTLYRGNYTSFEAKKTALIKERTKAYLENQAEIKREEEIIRKLKSFNREKSVRRATSREKALGKIAKVEKPQVQGPSMRLSFAVSKKSGRDVLFADGVGMKWDGNFLFRGVDFTAGRGEKIAVIGPNGAGKTTFLKILARLLAPAEGEVEFGAGVAAAYYDQEHHGLDGKQTVFEEIASFLPTLTNTEIRNFLALFLFRGDDCFKEVGELSGGEKGRLALLKLMLSGANLLFLDEPTNHLDMSSRAVLEEALADFEGTVIFVSHDRYFTNRVAERVLALSDGKFYDFPGNYDYYLSKIRDPAFQPEGAAVSEDTFAAHRSPASAAGIPFAEYASASPAGITAMGGENLPATSSSAPPTYEEQKERRNRARSLRNRLKNIEEEISSLEKEVSATEEKMLSPDIAADAAELYKLSLEKEDLCGRLAKLYNEWEVLESGIAVSPEKGGI